LTSMRQVCGGGFQMQSRTLRLRVTARQHRAVPAVGLSRRTRATVCRATTEDTQNERIKSTLADLDALLGIQEEPKASDKVCGGDSASRQLKYLLCRRINWFQLHASLMRALCCCVLSNARPAGSPAGAAATRARFAHAHPRLSGGTPLNPASLGRTIGRHCGRSCGSGEPAEPRGAADGCG
jgi:hypothetical protein